MIRPTLFALAVAATLGSTDPSLADEWTMDPAASRLGFSGTQTGTPFKGTFKHFDAAISFDPAHPEAAHVVVVIDMASASTGDVQRDEALPQADWFDATKFPKARFEATSFRAKGGNRYDAVGSLSIRGMSHDVVLPVTLDVSSKTAHATGRLQLVRTAFGVGQGAWAGADWVALEVGVEIDVTATSSARP